MKKLAALVTVALLAAIVFFIKNPFIKEKTTVAKIEKESADENEYEDDMAEAMAQEFTMTKDPALGFVPKERLIKAQLKAEEILNTRQNLYQTEALTWQERGPNNVAGRVRAMFIDKRDATGNTIFAAGVGGGIWKCTNFKTNPVWTVVNDFLGNLAVCAMAQDPNTPNTMYAGTGEGWFNTDAIRGNGIYKSTNGGTTWTQLSSTDAAAGVDFEFVNEIIVTSNGTVFAACRSNTFCNRGGVLRSTNGGNSWERVIGEFPAGSTACTQALNFRGADLDIAANGDLYATTGHNSSASNNTGRIWKSSAANNGALGTWTDITPIPTSGVWARIELACAPGNASHLLALIAGTNNAINSIQRSTDAGISWTTITTPNWCDQGVNKADFTRGQAWYDLTCAFDPTNSNAYMIGGVDILKTVDNGNSFAQISQWASGCAGSFVHADIHNIVYYPGSSTEVIVATDGGIFYSADGGNSFNQRNTGFNITQYYGLALHPASGSNYMLAGAQDNGTQRFLNSGVNTTTSPLGGDGGLCFIDQDDPNIQIGSFTSTNYRISRNGGSSFGTAISNGSGRFINPSDYDNTANVLYHAIGANVLGLISSIDVGAPVASSISISSLNGTQVSAVKVDPNTPKRVWIAGSGSVVPVVLKIDDATEAVPVITACALPVSNAGGYISSIDVEKGNSDHLLITLSNYGVSSVHESIDGGLSWNAIEGNLPDMPVRWGIFLPEGLTFSVNGVSGIALATEVGVWTTSASNGASTVWVPNNAGMANVCTYMLKYRAADRTIGAATHGRGLFTSILGTATAVNSIQNNKQFISAVYPTVVTDNIQFSTGGASGIRQMNVQIVDIQGKQLVQNTISFKNGQIPVSKLPAGMYFIKFISDNRKYTHLQKIVKQ